MTDSFEARGDFLPETTADIQNDIEINVIPDFSDAPASAAGADSSLEAIAPQPNGFVKLGLAKELLQAVADMGFTQPTAVQMATIPKAMQALDADPKATKFTDLMVSSQTGKRRAERYWAPKSLITVGTMWGARRRV